MTLSRLNPRCSSLRKNLSTVSYSGRTKHGTKAVPVYSDSNIEKVATAKPPSDSVANTNPDAADSSVTVEGDNVAANVEVKAEEPMAIDDLPQAISASGPTVAPTTNETQTPSMTTMPDSTSTTTSDELSKKNRDESETKGDERPEEPLPRATRRHSSIYETMAIPEIKSDETDNASVAKRSSSDEEKSMSVEDLEAVANHDDIVIRIAARDVPKYIYKQPKIKVKHTKTAKFRHMYNRRPKGARVYFKPLGQFEKKKPPFIVTAVSRCNAFS